MIKELQQLNFPNDTLGVDQIFESFRHLFDRYFYLGLMIVSTTDNAVRAMSDLFYIFKLILDQETRA